MYVNTGRPGAGRLADEARLASRRTPGLTVAACLFAAAGGYLDAYSYLAHGHVFANAQTGNVVLFAVHAYSGEWAEAGRHLPPIAAFALGVAVAKLIAVHSEKRSFPATLFCQVFELAILSALAAAGARLPDSTVVPMISFIAALQNTSFDRIGPWAFNSAMTTGNLRDATSGLVLWILGRDVAENRDKAVTLGFICFSFFAGALCGARFTRLYGKHSLLPCLAIVAAGLLLTWRESRRRIS